MSVTKGKETVMVMMENPHASVRSKVSSIRSTKAIKAMKTSNSGAMTADGANGVVEVYRVL